MRRPLALRRLCPLTRGEWFQDFNAIFEPKNWVRFGKRSQIRIENKGSIGFASPNFISVFVFFPPQAR